MNPVVHFEMPAEDKKRMADFYARAFGWKFQFFGPEMGEYILVSTCETDETGMPKKTGRINGGFYQKTADTMSHHPSVVVAVSDIKASMKLVTDSGGKVLGEPIDIPGVGAYVSFIDTEGNRASMLQPLPM